MQALGYHYFRDLSMYPVSETDEHIISEIFMGYWLIIGKIPYATC